MCTTTQPTSPPATTCSKQGFTEALNFARNLRGVGIEDPWAGAHPPVAGFPGIAGVQEPGGRFWVAWLQDILNEENVRACVCLCLCLGVGCTQ